MYTTKAFDRLLKKSHSTKKFPTTLAFFFLNFLLVFKISLKWILYLSEKEKLKEKSQQKGIKNLFIAFSLFYN